MRLADQAPTYRATYRIIAASADYVWSDVLTLSDNSVVT